MKKIRRGVFESNSSSTHSFSYAATINDLEVDDDNCVHTDLGKFGWEIRTYDWASVKLAYILLAAASLTGHDFWWNDDRFTEELESFKETEQYQAIEDAVKLHMDCDGIVINEGSSGYIDHQSIEYGSFDEWLWNTGADSIEDFIFGNIALHTDNDNH